MQTRLRLTEGENMLITAWNVRNDEQREYKLDDVQMTYDMLRGTYKGEYEDEFAVYDPKCQNNNPTDISDSPDGWVFIDGFIASDFTISPT